MALRLIRGASFRELERRLVRDLGGRAGTPLWVVAPTAGVANHVRLRVLGSVGSEALAGIRAVPLSGFVERLALATGIRPGVRRGPLLDLLLHHLCQQAPDLEIARSMAQIRNGSRFLMPTFRDLGDGGFGPSQTELLIELARQPDLATVESEVLFLYVRWLEMLEKAEVDWAPLQAQRLADALDDLAQGRLRKALGSEGDQLPHVFFHGFYELTDVNTQLLAALSRRVPTCLYFPFATDSSGKRSHPAFSFATPILEDLEFRLGSCLEAAEDLDRIPAEPPAEFFLRHFPEGDLPQPPPFLSWQSASGVRAEAISAAMRIRRWLDEDDSLQPADILVAAPDVVPYLSILPEVFRDFSLPLRISSVPASPDASEKLLRGLGRLWEEGAASEWVLSQLRDSPQAEHHEQFEERVRERGIWGGRCWGRAIEASQDWSDSELERIQHLAKAFAPQGAADSIAWTPRQALHHLEEMEKFWLDGEGRLQDQRHAIEKLSPQLPDLSIPQALLRDWLLESGAERSRNDRCNRQAALFTPLMRSRGLTARRLVLLGLACGQLPFPIDQDPLLSDESRRRLAAQARHVGHRLPVKTRAAEEQTMLFLLLNTSAEQVHWVIPESDESGRALAPTPWVQRFLQHWESAPRAAGRFEPLPRGPRQQSMQMLHADAAQGGLLPPRWAGLLGFNLCAGQPAADRRGPRSDVRLPSLSVTALETLARCPFRFYARYAADWTPLEPLSPLRQPSALLRGKLLHRALERLLAEPLEQGLSLPAAARSLLRNQAQRLKESVEQVVDEAFAARIFPHRLMQQAVAASLTRTLTSYMRDVAGGAKYYLESLEAKFQRPAHSFAGATVSGKIDRVDLGDFQQRRIIDYKSGKLAVQLDLEVRAGFRLQPSLYPWLCADRPAADASFAYVFLGQDPPRTQPVDDAPEASEMLASLAVLLQTGRYFPTSNEAWTALGLAPLKPCQGCQMASACRRHSHGCAEISRRLFTEKAQARLQHLLKIPVNSVFPTPQ